MTSHRLIEVSTTYDRQWLDRYRQGVKRKLIRLLADRLLETVKLDVDPPAEAAPSYIWRTLQQGNDEVTAWSVGLVVEPTSAKIDYRAYLYRYTIPMAEIENHRKSWMYETYIDDFEAVSLRDVGFASLVFNRLRELFRGPADILLDYPGYRFCILSQLFRAYSNQESVLRVVAIDIDDAFHYEALEQNVETSMLDELPIGKRPDPTPNSTLPEAIKNSRLATLICN